MFYKRVMEDRKRAGPLIKKNWILNDTDQSGIEGESASGCHGP